MTERRGRCPDVRKEIGGNMEIRRFVREEGRKLIVGRIGKLEINVRDGRWIWIWRREIWWFEKFV